MRLDEMNARLARATEKREIPGAVLLCGRGGDIYCHEAYGCAQWIPDEVPMTRETVFDLASVTKLTGTWPGILLLLQEGKLTLGTKLPDMLSQPVHPALSEATLWHLLTHTAGLIPGKHPDVFGETREERLRGLFMTPPDKPLGKQVVYSDISFIMLGEILSQAREKPLNLAAKDVFDALDMRETGYLPPKEAYCAATEIKNGVVRRGAVHDETATMLGGVAGHAGVFSTARDLAKFCAAILPPKKSELFSQEWLDRCYTNQTAHLGSDRCLGWIAYKERPEGNIAGHTGFTGTSIWMDTVSGEYVILLTNRVHPTRENGALQPIRHELFRMAFGVDYD